MSKDEFEAQDLQTRCDLIEGKFKFCPQRWLIGINGKLQDIFLNKEFLVFSIVTYIILNMQWPLNNIQFIAYVALGAIFIFAEALRILIAYRTEMKINANAGLTINKGSLK